MFVVAARFAGYLSARNSDSARESTERKLHFFSDTLLYARWCFGFMCVSSAFCLRSFLLVYADDHRGNGRASPSFRCIRRPRATRGGIASFINLTKPTHTHTYARRCLFPLKKLKALSKVFSRVLADRWIMTDRPQTDGKDGALVEGTEHSTHQSVVKCTRSYAAAGCSHR